MTTRRRKGRKITRDREYWGQEPKKDVKGLLAELDKVADSLVRLLGDLRSLVG